jgi:hypothetical protein
LGDRAGTCHGFSRLTASAAHNIHFNCNGTATGGVRGAELLRRAHILRLNGCRQRLDIEGFCDLAAFCEANRDILSQWVVEANTATYLGEFIGRYAGRVVGLAPEQPPASQDRVQTMALLEELHRRLGHGEYPILYANRRDVPSGPSLVDSMTHSVTVAGLSVQPVDAAFCEMRSCPTDFPSTYAVEIFTISSGGRSSYTVYMNAAMDQAYDPDHLLSIMPLATRRRACADLIRGWERADGSDGWAPF